MRSRRWLNILLTISLVMAMATYTGVTTSLFIDDEQSTDDSLVMRWGLFTLNDGFEKTGSPPWDDYWNENGTTTWLQSSSKPYSGTYAVRITNNDTPGYLTSDEIEASTADNITVSFWFNLKSLEAGDLVVQTYNGTSYNILFDLINYPTYANNTWSFFNEVITEPQYLIAGFRLRFDASAMGDSTEEANIDDVVITTDTISPAAPTGLAAAPGGELVSLDWDDNTEPDLWGYNVYRSLTSGNYTQVNGSVVLSSDYTDTVYGGDTYFYVVTAVDLGNNESGYSNEDSATATDIAPAVPTGLAATPGGELVSLDWDNNIEGDLAGYNVYRSLTSGSGYSQIGSLVSTSNYTDTLLYGGGTYYYVVTAVDLGSNPSSDSNEASATATDIAPAVPTGLAATPGGELVSLDWDNNIEGDLAGYNVYRSLTSGSGYSQINGSLVSTSNYTDTLLYGGGTYYYVVTAVDVGNNESGNSNEDTATATDIAPAVPTLLPAAPGGELMSLDWDDNTEPDLWGYNVYRSTTSGSGYSQVNGSVVLSSDYTDTPLYGGGTYFYVVTAVDVGSNESGNSNEVSANATDIAPAVPTGLAATPGGELVNLNWDDNTEGDMGGYNVYRNLTGGDPWGEPIGSLVSTSNYTDTRLYGGGTYYYVVTAVDVKDNESGNSNEVSANATDIAPAAPTNLVAMPGGELVNLNWDINPEGDLDGYNVYRSLTGGGPYTQINGSPVSNSNYTDTGRTNGVTYFYVVTAVDVGSNQSGYSNEGNATPTNAPPLAPTGLITTPGDREVSLNWNDNAEGDLDGYNVYRSTSSGSGYSQINGSLVSTSDYIDNTVHGGVTYYYVVTAVDTGALESGYSNEASATPASPILIIDGFEDTPWDGNWDENGTTTWVQELTPSHSGTYSTHSDQNDFGYLTSDDIDASASTNITVNFWFYPKNLELGDVLVQTYNGTAYNTWYDLTNYPTFQNNQWNEFSEMLSDSQYFISGFRLRFDTSVGLDGNDNINIDGVLIFTDSIPPAPPGNLAAFPDNTQVSLVWDGNTEPDLDGYNVYRSLTSDNYTQINGSLVSTSNYTDTGLTNGTLYYYVVTAVDLGSNESGDSNEASATPIDNPPAAPGNLSAFPDNTQVSLDWDDNAEGDLDGYNVYRSLTSDNYTQINGSLVSTSNYTDTGLTNGTLYYYVVRAVDLGSNESGDSNEASATPIDNPPAAPNNLAATPGNTQVSLDWDNNAEPDLDGYNVYRSLTSDNYTQINGSLVSTNNYTDTGLTNGVTYYYVVTAVDVEDNESGYSSEASATPIDYPPAAPSNLTATPGNTQVSLDWDDNAEGDLAGYNVYRSLTSDNYTQQLNVGLVSTSNYTDTGLTNGTLYYYVVTAVDIGALESGNSNEVSATPFNPPLTLIDDGFEDTVDWDVNWDDNGITTWTQEGTPTHSGSYSAHSSKNNNVSLTTDDLDASAAENITVSFWFLPKALEAGDIIIEIYNGSTYATWYDLFNYPTYVENTWSYFSETITDSQYFVSNFRIRFNTSALTDGNDNLNIDDVLIKTNQ